MKKIRYVIFLMLGVLALCGAYLFYTITVAANAKSQIEEIQSMVLAGKKNYAKENINTLDAYWQQHQFFLSMAIHHDVLSEIENSIKLMQINIATNPEDNSDFWSNSTLAITAIDNLEKTEVPSFENIL